MYPTHSFLSWAFTALPEIISSRHYEFCCIKRKGPIIIEFNVQTQCQRVYWVYNAERSVHMKISKVLSALTLSGTEKALWSRTGSRETSSGCTLVRSPRASHIRETAGREFSLVVSLPTTQDVCFYVFFSFSFLHKVVCITTNNTDVTLIQSGKYRAKYGPPQKGYSCKPPAFWWIPN